MSNGYNNIFFFRTFSLRSAEEQVLTLLLLVEHPMAPDPPLWISIRITGAKEAALCHSLHCQGVTLSYFCGL